MRHARKPPVPRVTPTSTAAATFIVGAIVWAALSVADQGSSTAPPEEAAVEVRLSSHGGVSRLFVGQPLVVDVVLLNLEARRARNQAQVDPAAATAAAEIVLDADGRPWEQQLIMTLSTPGGATVLTGPSGCSTQTARLQFVAWHWRRPERRWYSVEVTC